MDEVYSKVCRIVGVPVNRKEKDRTIKPKHKTSLIFEGGLKGLGHMELSEDKIPSDRYRPKSEWGFNHKFGTSALLCIQLQNIYEVDDSVIFGRTIFLEGEYNPFSKEVRGAFGIAGLKKVSYGYFFEKQLDEHYTHTVGIFVRRTLWPPIPHRILSHTHGKVFTEMGITSRNDPYFENKFFVRLGAEISISWHTRKGHH